MQLRLGFLRGPLRCLAFLCQFGGLLISQLFKPFIFEPLRFAGLRVRLFLRDAFGFDFHRCLQLGLADGLRTRERARPFYVAEIREVTGIRFVKPRSKLRVTLRFQFRLLLRGETFRKLLLLLHARLQRLAQRDDFTLGRVKHLSGFERVGL